MIDYSLFGKHGICLGRFTLLLLFKSDCIEKPIAVNNNPLHSHCL